MKRWQKLLAGAGALAAGAGWIGLQQPATSLLPPAEQTETRGSRPLPAGLPAPVHTYLRRALGERVPLMDSAHAWGTARLRLGPVWTSLRWRGYYVPGHDFFRTLEVVWFDRPLVTGYDAYVDADGVLSLGAPLHIFETGPAVSQAENMTLWAESALFPAVLAGPRARWEPLTATAATLHFPAAGAADALRAAFDPESGLLRELSGRRYRADAEQKGAWRLRYSQYRPVGGLETPVEIPHRAVAQWADEADPYADFLLDGIVYNVDVSAMVPVEEAPDAP